LCAQHHGTAGVVHRAQDFSECGLGQRRRDGEHQQTTGKQQSRSRTTANTYGERKTMHEKTFQEKLPEETSFFAYQLFSLQM
jgi:hypothetical protein